MPIAEGLLVADNTTSSLPVADNTTSSLPAAGGDWRIGEANFMTEQDKHDPTSDAGKREAGASLKVDLKVGGTAVACATATAVLAQPGYGPGPNGIDALSALLTSNGLVTHTMHIPYLNFPPYQKLIDHVCSDLGQAQAITTWVGDDQQTPHLSDHRGVVASFPV